MDIYLIRIFFVAVVGLAAGGCAATGPLYKSHAAKYQALAADVSRVVVYRPHYWVGQAVDTRIQIDGAAVAECANKGFTTFDIYPGRYRLSVDTWGSPGKCELTVSLDPGREYFFEIKNRSEALTAGLLGGVIGQALESSGKECGGAYSIEPIDREIALDQLAELRLTDEGGSSKIVGKPYQQPTALAEVSQPAQGFNVGSTRSVRPSATLHERAPGGGTVQTVLAEGSQVSLLSSRSDAGYVWWWVRTGDREGWILQSELEGQ